MGLIYIEGIGIKIKQCGISNPKGDKRIKIVILMLCPLLKNHKDLSPPVLH
jgi:hypothetical protein